MKVAHITSVHSRYDTRIFVKMCSSLAANSYSVSLIVADGQGDEIINNVYVQDVGKKKGRRLFRMINTVHLVYKQAIKVDADIYHLHDPELMSIAMKLKRTGKIVIFDAHEDLPQQMLAKPYLNKSLLFLLSKSLTLYEKYICRRLDAVITATPFIRDKFLKINKNSVDINNYPIASEFKNNKEWIDKKNELAYVGGIEEKRGISEIIEALDTSNNIKLNLAGKFNDCFFEKSLKQANSWSKVNYLGFLTRENIAKILARSKAGLVTLYPISNYLDSLPVKMFEYMAAGIPVIASDFPLWKSIIEENECGICVDPLSSQSIETAIKYIINNPDKAEKMGSNGRIAIEKKYNWEIEENKLLSLYRELLN